MKKQRYLPFGYQMQEGKITIHPKESKLVSDIFISYMDGDTLQSIANQLQLTGILYSETSGVWSKHMVRRILENAKYCGQDGFPALIDRDVFTKALKLRQQKAQTPLSGIGDIRKYMACACCHSKLKIDLGTRGKIYWRCHSCGIRIGPIQNEVLIEAVFSYMNDCIQNPDIFKNTSERENSISLQIGKLTQNI